MIFFTQPAVVMVVTNMKYVPEISSLDAFCDKGAVVGIGDSRSWMQLKAAHTTHNSTKLKQLSHNFKFRCVNNTMKLYSAPINQIP